MNFEREQKFDVLIVGGGVIGLCMARELRERGVERIGILEKNAACGLESSSAAAGMLAPQAEADSPDDFFDLCQQSRHIYPQFAAALSEETGVDIEFDQTGTLYLAFTDGDLNEIERRFEWQTAAGLPIEKLSRAEVAAIEPNLSPRVAGALRFPLDWQIKNTMLVAALAKLFPKIEIDDFSSSNSSGWLSVNVERFIFADGKVIGVETASGKIWATVVIISAGAWTSQLVFPVEVSTAIKIAPVRGQMISFRENDKPIAHNIYTPRGYIVPRRGKQILVGATVENAEFDNRTTGAGVAFLLGNAFEIAPHLQNLSINKIWSGLRPKSLDGLPLLGEFPANSNLYFATGHYRNGILLAPITAKLIADKIAKNVDSPFLQIFNPNRFVNNS